ncbi:hypothetical protein, no similarity [Geotrichum candidum]|uniref:Uncharacterized protein n=1 Tax=Geotrichum candidum TaxID=1173061 RepID=A0A0J9X988_GEOCN|nr:hypothetical protein, no similarity [Geotrichum candidum]
MRSGNFCTILFYFLILFFFNFVLNTTISSFAVTCSIIHEPVSTWYITAIGIGGGSTTMYGLQVCSSPYICQLWASQHKQLTCTISTSIWFLTLSSITCCLFNFSPVSHYYSYLLLQAPQTNPFSVTKMTAQMQSETCKKDVDSIPRWLAFFFLVFKINCHNHVITSG